MAHYPVCPEHGLHLGWGRFDCKRVIAPQPLGEQGVDYPPGRSRALHDSASAQALQRPLGGIGPTQTVARWGGPAAGGGTACNQEEGLGPIAFAVLSRKQAIDDRAEIGAV